MENDFYMEGFADNIDEKTIILVKQLTLKCPAEDPRDSCPFSELRKLPLKERLEKVDKMFSEEIEELVQKHYDCFEGRK